MAANLFTWTKARVWALPGLKEEMKRIAAATAARRLAREAAADAAKEDGDAE